MLWGKHQHFPSSSPEENIFKSCFLCWPKSLLLFCEQCICCDSFQEFLWGFFCHCSWSKVLEGVVRIEVSLELVPFLFSAAVKQLSLELQEGMHYNKQYSTGCVFLSYVTNVKTQNVTNNVSGLKFWEKYFHTVSYLSFCNKESSYDRKKFKW